MAEHEQCTTFTVEEIRPLVAAWAIELCEKEDANEIKPGTADVWAQGAGAFVGYLYRMGFTIAGEIISTDNDHDVSQGSKSVDGQESS